MHGQAERKDLADSRWANKKTTLSSCLLAVTQPLELMFVYVPIDFLAFAAKFIPTALRQVPTATKVIAIGYEFMVFHADDDIEFFAIAFLTCP